MSVSSSPSASRRRTDDELLRRVAADQPISTAPTRSLLREEVYSRIRGWILDGLLPAGVRLRDVEIAEVLQVSRTPVREAIRRLQDEGLVQAEAHRWTKVAAVEIEAADDIYPIIWTLERLALTLAVTPTAERLAAMRAANLRLAEALDRNDARGASDADNDFHQQVVELARNPDLEAVLAQVKVRLRRIEIAYFDGGAAAGRQSVHEHELVIAALERGELERAADGVEQNWRASLSRLHAQLPGR